MCRLRSMEPTNFHYLNQSGCVSVDRRNEQEEWDDMMTAFSILGFPTDKRDAVLRCLAGILFLGNVDFNDREDENEALTLTSTDPLQTSSELFGLEADQMQHALVYREIVVGGETSLKPRDGKEARALRDSAAKAVYGHIFEWLVERVNDTLFQGSGACHIGLLDIFGFEIFLVNSFEQVSP